MTRGNKQEEGHQHGHRRGEAAKLLDFVGVAPVVEHPDTEEKRASGDAVIQHLVDRALNRDGVERKNAEYDETQVAHGRVSHEAFQIGLYGGHKRAVDDADNGEDGD